MTKGLKKAKIIKQLFKRSRIMVGGSFNKIRINNLVLINEIIVRFVNVCSLITMKNNLPRERV